MPRLSRLCYDKGHRCPGWAGGGMRSAKEMRCAGGRISALGYADGEPDSHPLNHPWRFGHCHRCDVVTWPSVTRWLDWRWLRWEIECLLREWRYRRG